MPVRNDPRMVVEAMAAHEGAIGDLYAAYAIQFREAADLWRAMADEEHTHAQMLHGLLQKADELRVFVDADRFNPVALRTSREYVVEQTRVVEGSSLSLRTALAIAIQLEGALIESRAFEVFDSDTVSVRTTLDRLREDTARHRQRLRDRLAGL